MNQEKVIEFKDNKNICRCPLSEIQYLIGVENLEAIDVKTGFCLRCKGIRLNKLGFVLQGKRKIKKKEKDGKLI